MIGKNPLWVAKQHGHSVQTMLETHAAWPEGTSESDLAAIRTAMETPPQSSIRVPAPSCRWQRSRNGKCLTTGSS
jgi:hypothetical protein